MATDDRLVEQMLDATFSFARLALGHAVLLNGAAATALIAFLSANANANNAPLKNAVIWFGVGALVGGLASVLAYFGQYSDWRAVRGEKKFHCAAKWLISVAMMFGTTAFVLFAVGAILAGLGFT